MQKKFTGIRKTGPGIMNAFGRRRGGAGAIAAILAVCAIVASMTVSVVGEIPQEDISNDDVSYNHPYSPEPVPCEKLTSEEPADACHGAQPNRLPR